MKALDELVAPPDGIMRCRQAVVGDPEPLYEVIREVRNAERGRQLTAARCAERLADAARCR